MRVFLRSSSRLLSFHRSIVTAFSAQFRLAIEPLGLKALQELHLVPFITAADQDVELVSIEITAFAGPLGWIVQGGCGGRFPQSAQLGAHGWRQLHEPGV